MTNIPSRVFVDDKYVGVAYVNKLFIHNVDRPGDYLIKLVEKTISDKYYIQKVVKVSEDIIVQFDFTEFLLDNQETITYDVGADGFESDKDLIFKKKGKLTEIWSAKHNLKLSEINNPFDSIVPFGYCHYNQQYYIKIFDNGTCSLLNLYGDVVIQIPEGEIDTITNKLRTGLYSINNKYGIFEDYGKVLKPAEYTCVYVGFCFTVIANQTECCIIEYQSGKIFKMECDSYEIHNEYVLFKQGDKLGLYRSGGYDDGKIFPCEYEEISMFEESLDYGPSMYLIKQNGKYGITDLLPCSYDMIKSIGYLYLIVKDSNGYGLLSDKGELIVETKFEDILTPQEFVDCYYEADDEDDEDTEVSVPEELDGRYICAITKEKHIYLYDMCKKRWLTEYFYNVEFYYFEYYEWWHKSPYSYLLARKDNRVWVYVDGNCILENVEDAMFLRPMECDENTNLFLFQIGARIGVVDSKGKIIMPAKYDEIRVESADIHDENKANYVFYVWSEDDIICCYNHLGKFIKSYPKNQKIENIRYFNNADSSFLEVYNSFDDGISGAGFRIE